MATDALMTSIVRTSATMVLTMQDIKMGPRIL